MPYSCQLQFGTSGNCVTPVGGARTCRAIGLPMSQTSRLTMLQKTTRAPPGSLSGGRSTIAEKSQRSRGSIGFAPAFFFAALVIAPSSSIESRRPCPALQYVKVHGRVGGKPYVGILT